MKIDENREYVTLGYDGSDAIPLKVDPVTGYLLVSVYKDSTSHGSRRARTDENKEGSSQAVDTNGNIKPLLMDSNGYLLVTSL